MKKEKFFIITIIVTLLILFIGTLPLKKVKTIVDTKKIPEEKVYIKNIDITSNGSGINLTSYSNNNKIISIDEFKDYIELNNFVYNDYNVDYELSNGDYIYDDFSSFTDLIDNLKPQNTEVTFPSYVIKTKYTYDRSLFGINYKFKEVSDEKPKPEFKNKSEKLFNANIKLTFNWRRGKYARGTDIIEGIIYSPNKIKVEVNHY